MSGQHAVGLLASLNRRPLSLLQSSLKSLGAISLLLVLASQAHAERCQASVYSIHDKDQNGTKTASGIPLNDAVPSIAHKTLPLKSRASVTNLQNGKQQTFIVTDRGPYVKDRCVDLNVAAAILLGCRGLCPVEIGQR